MSSSTKPRCSSRQISIVPTNQREKETNNRRATTRHRLGIVVTTYLPRTILGFLTIKINLTIQEKNQFQAFINFPAKMP